MKMYMMPTPNFIGDVMSIDEHFAEFHRANPHVYDRLEAIALELFRAGRKRISLRDLWGYIRIERLLVATNGAYRFNNNHISRYSRMLLEKHPQLESVVELREIKGTVNSSSYPSSWHEAWMDAV